MFTVAFVLFAADIALFVSCGAVCDTITAEQGAVRGEVVIYVALVAVMFWRFRALYVFATGPAILTRISFAETRPWQAVAVYNALGSWITIAGALGGALPAVVAHPSYGAFALSLAVVSLGNVLAACALDRKGPARGTRRRLPSFRELRAMRPPRLVAAQKPRRKPPPVPSEPSPDFDRGEEVAPGVYVSRLLDTSEESE